MKRFEIEYRQNEDSDTTSTVRVIADNERKALKAFSLKVPEISRSQLVSINGQKLQDNWTEAYRPSVASSPATGVAGSAGDANGSTRLSDGAQPTNQGDGENYILGIIGILMVLGGAYFLVIEPGANTGLGNIVNLQKLFVGQTLTLAGSVFVAAQWRPPRR